MAMHGRTMREIAECIDPDNIPELMHEFYRKGSELEDAFRTGSSSMGPDIKLIAAQAEIESIYLARHRKVDLMIAEYLGENINDVS